MIARQFEEAEPELMDRPDASPAELEAALHSLYALNRYFGSYRIIARFLRRWMKQGDRLRVLDLCTGSADIPRFIAERARKVGAEVAITAVDFQPTTIAMARRMSADYPEIDCVQADVLQYKDAELYDLVVCSLALHHFSEADAVRLLQRARELSRRHVLISDLRRGLLGIVGVHLLTAVIFSDRMTRADGRASVRRAFTLAELCALARRAGWENFRARRFRFARQAIWIE